MRTCAGCGRSKSKRELLRIVRTPEGVVVVDRSGKVSGRGTYVCYCEECVDAAIRGKRLAYVLNIDIDDKALSHLREEILQTIEEIITVD